VFGSRLVTFHAHVESPVAVLSRTQRRVLSAQHARSLGRAPAAQFCDHGRACKGRSAAARGHAIWRTSWSSIPALCGRSRKTWCATSRRTAGGCADCATRTRYAVRVAGGAPQPGAEVDEEEPPRLFTVSLYRYLCGRQVCGAEGRLRAGFERWARARLRIILVHPLRRCQK
jgi:hypothetical protein